MRFVGSFGETAWGLAGRWVGVCFVKEDRLPKGVTVRSESDFLLVGNIVLMIESDALGGCGCDDEWMD